MDSHYKKMLENLHGIYQEMEKDMDTQANRFDAIDDKFVTDKLSDHEGAVGFVKLDAEVNYGKHGQNR